MFDRVLFLGRREGGLTTWQLWWGVIPSVSPDDRPWDTNSSNEKTATHIFGCVYRKPLPAPQKRLLLLEKPPDDDRPPDLPVPVPVRAPAPRKPKIALKVSDSRTRWASELRAKARLEREQQEQQEQENITVVAACKTVSQSEEQAKVPTAINTTSRELCRRSCLALSLRSQPAFLSAAAVQQVTARLRLYRRRQGQFRVRLQFRWCTHDSVSEPVMCDRPLCAHASLLRRVLVLLRQWVFVVSLDMSGYELLPAWAAKGWAAEGADEWRVEDVMAALAVALATTVMVVVEVSETVELPHGIKRKFAEFRGGRVARRRTVKEDGSIIIPEVEEKAEDSTYSPLPSSPLFSGGNRY